MTQPKYCLPIIKSRPEDVLETIQNNSDDYSYFEVWLDYITELNKDFIKELVELAGKQLIIVFRRQKLEAIHMDLKQRLTILEQLDKSSILVDLDILSQTAELDHLKDRQLDISIIASYHNYKKTPDTVHLEAIIGTMTAYNPSIYKLATLCEKEADALRLLSFLLQLKEKGLPCIILGRGKFGKITRIFGTLWGNEMIFAPRIHAEESDIGQLTRDELDLIFKALKE